MMMWIEDEDEDADADDYDENALQPFEFTLEPMLASISDISKYSTILAKTQLAKLHI